jgi:HD-like signal output (HDOD) protein
MPSASPPTLPATAARLLVLCAQDEFSLLEFVRVIEADPAISSRLLRLANSAYFGFSRKIDTLDRAVQALGRATVQAVALGHSLLRFWEGGALPSAVEGLWVHSYLCALGCRHLAHRLPRDCYLSEPDTLFLTGLLHDIGKILFLVDAPAPYRSALDECPTGESLLAWERQRFGRDHAEAGGDALEAWNVPFPIAAVVRYHHVRGLRAELQSDWHVLRAVDDLLTGLEPDVLGTSIPQSLVADLAPHMERFAAEARTFYQVIQ